MADKAGQADIRGLDIDKIAKGYADEVFVLKTYCNVSNTAARQIRWYKKTAGTLDSTDTTGMTGSEIYNSADQLAIPTVIGNSWTLQNDYVRKFFVESRTLSDEDIRDTDIGILVSSVGDLVRAVAQQVNIRIFSVFVEAAASTPTTPNPTNINRTYAAGTGWDDATNGNPISDILSGSALIDSYNYDSSKAILIMHPDDRKNLITWLISTKGSSIPNFSSDKVRSGKVMEILGHRVVSTNNVTKDYVYMIIPQRSVSWRTFTPITTAIIKDPGIGTKIRVWEEGEALLTDPSSVCIIQDTMT